jgi:hypothetical protein
MNTVFIAGVGVTLKCKRRHHFPTRRRFQRRLLMYLRYQETLRLLTTPASGQTTAFAMIQTTAGSALT